ncbi:hypothetical protein GCM10023166_08850 [Paeniglutamicibacter cryotolerans]
MIDENVSPEESGSTDPRIRPRFARPVAIAALAAALLSMTACAPIATVQPADDAANPLCAQMMVQLPQEISGQALRKTNSQATAVWGEPSQLVLRCGVVPPAPSSDPCVSVNGVDWLAKEGKLAKDGERTWTLTTYGRTPATELLFDPQQIPSSTVLATLSGAAAKIPAQRQCSNVEKTVDVP